MKVSNRSTLFTRILTLFLALGMAMVYGTAMGQDAGDDDEFLLEDIVVTSEFREKSIQETPLSVTAVNADMMESRNQINLAEIAVNVPGLTLRPNSASLGSSLVAFIRGIGQTDFNPSVEPGVAIYVDDVYYSTITGNILDLLDLERVEVLRGPQGTLAGRNAIGGAIKLFTRQADGSDDGYVSLTYGDFDRLDVKGAAGFTLIEDELFVRFAGVSRSRDGYITRLDYACHNNLPAPGNPGGLPTYAPTILGSMGCTLGTEGGQSMTAGRFSMRWLPSDNFTVSFAMNIVNDNSEGQPNVLVEASDNSGSGIPIYFQEAGPPIDNPAWNPNSVALVPIFFDNNGNGTYERGIDIGYDDRFVTGGTYTNYATYINDGMSTPHPAFIDFGIYANYSLPVINHLESVDYTLNLDWQLTDNVSLLSVTSYREYLNEFADDNDGSPLAMQQLLQRMDHEQFTQEFRLNANNLWDGFADLTLGLFYLDKETNEDARVDINYIGLHFLHGPDLVPSEARAAYGQMDLHLTDRMDLTLGVRYSEDEKSYTFGRHNPDGTDVSGPVVTVPGHWQSGNPLNAGVYGVNGINISYESDRWDYRAALNYDFSDNVMGYLQIATGYKGGGNNARPFYPSQLIATKPEELLNYEVGVKSTIADQLRLNASVFFNDYTDLQLMVSECSWAPEFEQTPCASVYNVGDAEIQGLELEGVWRPTRAFSLDFSYAYLDFEYTKIDESTGVALDSAAPFTPEHAWSIGAQYTFGLDNDWGDLTARLDYSYQDDHYSAALNTRTALVDAYSVLNGRLTWRSEDTKWEMSLEGTNLTDKYYYLTLYDLLAAAGYTSGQPARPREFAFTVKRFFFTD